MKPIVKLVLRASLATIPFVSSYATADGKIVPGYVTTVSSGEIVRTSFGECWRQPDWTPDKAVPECEGKVAEVEPAAEPTREIPASVPAEEHLTLSDDAGTGEALFDFNKAQLRHDSREKLDGLLDRVKSFLTVDRVVITGHADRLGSDAYNMRLSRRRAEAVRDYLQDREIADPSRVEVDARGESEPVVGCEEVRARKKLIVCLAPNRRVQVDVTGTKAAN
jgi:OOP family OmpA-OmpF porin